MPALPGTQRRPAAPAQPRRQRLSRRYDSTAGQRRVHWHSRQPALHQLGQGALCKQRRGGQTLPKLGHTCTCTWQGPPRFSYQEPAWLAALLRAVRGMPPWLGPFLSWWSCSCGDAVQVLNLVDSAVALLLPSL